MSSTAAMVEGGGMERTFFYVAIGVATGSLFGLPLQLDLVWSSAYLVIGYAAVLAVFGYHMGRRENRLREASVVDPRTQVASFRALQHRLAQEVDHATRHRLALSLLFVEVGRSDGATHSIALPKVAQALRGLCRAADFIALCEGTRLAIVAPCSTARQASQLAERILDELEEEETRARLGTLQAVIGISELHAAGNTTAARLLQSAEQALLIARVGGREVWIAGDDSAALEDDLSSGPRRGATALGTDARVVDIMTRRVVCLRPETPVARLHDLFRERDIGGAPVLDEAGRILGIVSKSELLRSCLDAPRANQVVDDIMTSIVFRLPEDATVAQAAALMAYEGVARIVIVSSDGVIVGILSAEDILRCVGPVAPQRDLVPRQVAPESSRRSLAPGAVAVDDQPC